MPFNISEFRSSFGRKDPLHGGHYEVQLLGLPSELESEYGEILRNIKFRCSSALLPGKQLDSQERKTYGPSRNVPFSKTYVPLQVEFIEDSDMSIKKLMSAWQKLIITDEETLNYYDDFICEKLRIKMYSPSGEVAFEADAFEVFPQTVQDVQLSWDNADIVRISVEFEYREWKEKE